jgi:tRNA pseudouridine55 synthase
MARKKKGRKISGWMILDKPLELGSTQAVSKVKWLYQAQKAGHAGTLDPLASGLLPIALGEATKTVNHVMDGSKIYQFTVKWGEQTSTDDLEGKIIEQSDKRPSREEIEAILPHYIGDIEQTPPQFSAIKIDGERAYDLARAGEKVDIKSRDVYVHRLDIIEHDEGETSFECECEKGTYVRAFARDMGIELGCFGHISLLRRTAVGPFDEQDFVTLDELIALEGDFDGLDEMLLDIDIPLDHLPAVDLDDQDATRVRMGNPVLLRGRDAPLSADEALARVDGQAIALGIIEKGRFQPKKVFQL